MLLLIALYLGLVILLPLGLSAGVGYRTLPHGRGCPLCRTETFWVDAWSLRWINRVKPGDHLQQRWCATCGWEGYVRMTGLDLVDNPVARPAVGTSNTVDVLAEYTRPLPEIDEAVNPEPDEVNGMRVRGLRVDGRAWAVELQCWSVAERWYGRLLFVGPAGQRCADTLQPLNGGSPDDLLSQARALSERTLEQRVRSFMTTDG